MINEEEFVKEWKKMSQTLSLRIKEAFEVNPNVSVDHLNDLLNIQVNLWLTTANYRGIWMENLKKENKEVAIKFEKVLRSVSFKQIQVIPQKSNFTTKITCSLITGFSTFIILWLIHVPKWLTYTCTIITHISVFNFLKPSTNNKKSNSDIYRGQYIKQLDNYRDELIKILADV